MGGNGEKHGDLPPALIIEGLNQLNPAGISGARTRQSKFCEDIDDSVQIL